MKKLMLGNEAVARGLYEAGVKVVSSYPGTPSTEITEYAAKYDEIYCEWAPNEKVAAEVAFGASLRGVRSACAMKHVGLNVAADPLFTLSYTGVNGGLVLFVADDPAMHSSQNEQDSRHYAIAAKVPMIEPSDSAEAKEYVKQAFELSEEFDTPVIVRMCTRIAHSQYAVELEPRQEKPLGEYVKNPAKYIMAPANAAKRHPFVEERTKRLQEVAETSRFNRVEKTDSEMGIICAGTCYEYVKEVFGDSVSILKLGMINPLPEKLIRDFAAGVKQLYVIEELDGIIEQHVKALGVDCIGKQMFSPVGEYNQATIRRAFGMEEPKSVCADSEIPVRPPVMCAGCPHRGMFYTLVKNKVTVLGDIGCYTLGSTAPLFALDSTLCMGASVSGIHGFNKAGGSESEHKTACVIGDSTFMHSGMTGLVNIAYNNSNSTVIILDNSITGMTGHQQNPTTGYNIKGDPAAAVNLEDLCHAIGIHRVRVVDPYNLKECDEVLKEELAADEASVIISRRPCVLLKYVKPKPPVKVDADKCVSCKMCMKLGCPAISMKQGKAHIDFTQCVGCGVCEQLCKVGAIQKG
ncbi:MAG TPA: indolepyruvate ferredoxin oxidoreductase subunit alpha [Candidatus Faeciplasma gallinarum]|uniref:Indolepyruvate oxidoreductase subunit IorA n=1 Tax=Candidatus Faeciplasma gallinarum TaxID=2840799 RepID=A0A9D1ENK2_9FIRM|nr:indolepyruvate ferredoxin oxidoreductase subunit alpha [Candidatus Faeciplasma gallinarum]